MGTSGPDPFGGDTAEDLLDELEPLPPSHRLAALETIFRTAMVERSDGSATPEEVLAAAAIVAANITPGEPSPWDDEDLPAIGTWLPHPLENTLTATATEALDAVLPKDSWWFQSWVDPADRIEAETNLETLKSLLNTHRSEKSP